MNQNTTTNPKNAESLKSTKFESESNISSETRGVSLNLSTLESQKVESVVSLNLSTLESQKVESDSDCLPRDTTYSESNNNSSDEEEKVITIIVNCYSARFCC